MSVADNYWTCYVNVSLQTPRQEDEMGDHSPIAILFSGGLDSMILAAILDQCIDSKYTIDLLNVSFDGQLAPDRISARAGVAELQNVAPHRSWVALHEEMRLDVQRIWKRNMGRDDRCISDHGKEVSWLLGLKQAAEMPKRAIQFCFGCYFDMNFCPVSFSIVPVWFKNCKRIKSKELWKQPCSQPSICRKCQDSSFSKLTPVGAEIVCVLSPSLIP
ncbi:hypothetical protein B296_00019148 [Ensete ventricosum]|uniref:Asparagine synthetase domain-containing protein n=1 Tax=Ensete ventricosum TaxID=4639 RepID=A0A426ZFH3_ENSVE|nr:hypothetical protein B296_00019148 [Ensete ventricosum]